MATTTDMAPTRTASRKSASARKPAARSKAAPSREDELSEQIEQLQADLRTIAGTLAGLAEDKIEGAQALAKREAQHLKREGQHRVEDVQDEFGQLEKQLKDTIREKPLTAVAGAVALGFVLAVVSR